MKLYYAPRTRAGRPRWLLEELGVPYELARLDLSRGEHKSAEYRKIHPLGAVPALVDDGVVMFESAAICMYLADKHADKGLAPGLSSPARAAYYQWVVFTMATLEPPILQVFLNTVMLPEPKRSAEAAEQGRKQFADVARVVAGALRGREYLVGNAFSAADVMVGSTLAWSRALGLLADQPELEAYVQRLVARPAFQRASSD